MIYTWEGQTVEETSQPIITIQAGDSYLWQNTLATESGSHTAFFEAQWVPLASSYDLNPQNSFANGSVEVNAQLRLTWSRTSMELVDSNQEPATFPLMSGDEYTVSIKLASQETGTVNSMPYSRMDLEVSNPSTRNIEVSEEATIQFTISVSYTHLTLPTKA